MRIKAKVEIVLNTDGTWEVVRFLSGPTKQVKLGTKESLNDKVNRWRDEFPSRDEFDRLKDVERQKLDAMETPVQDALDNARKVRRTARRHDWSNTTRQVQTCRGCGHPGVNIRTCRGDGTHRPAKLYWRS